MIESAGQSAPHSCLPEECAYMCTVADSLLVGLIHRIKSGAVPFKEMETVNEKQYQIEKLCTANQGCDLDDFRALLEQRKAECCIFRRRKQILALFCREMKTARLNVEG